MSLPDGETEAQKYKLICQRSQLVQLGFESMLDSKIYAIFTMPGYLPGRRDHTKGDRKRSRQPRHVCHMYLKNYTETYSETIYSSQNE